VRSWRVSLAQCAGVPHALTLFPPSLSLTLLTLLTHPAVRQVPEKDPFAGRKDSPFAERGEVGTDGEGAPDEDEALTESGRVCPTQKEVERAGGPVRWEDGGRGSRGESRGVAGPGHRCVYAHSIPSCNCATACLRGTGAQRMKRILEARDKEEKEANRALFGDDEESDVCLPISSHLPSLPSRPLFPCLPLPPRPSLSPLLAMATTHTQR